MEPYFGIGLSLSLICKPTSEDIKHRFIILSNWPVALWCVPGSACKSFTAMMRVAVSRVSLSSRRFTATVPVLLLILNASCKKSKRAATKLYLPPSCCWWNVYNFVIKRSIICHPVSVGKMYVLKRSIMYHPVSVAEHCVFYQKNNLLFHSKNVTSWCNRNTNHFKWVCLLKA